MASIAELFVVIGAKTDQFEKGLNDMVKSGKAMQKDISSVFGNLLPAVTVAAVVGGFANMMGSASEYGEALLNAQQRTGLSVQGIQELTYASKASGATFQDVEQAIKKMQVAITNNDPALKKLGLNLAELKQMSPEEQFYAISAAIAEIPDSTTKAATAISIFGKSGTNLIPMINNVESLRQKAHDLNAVLSTDQVNALAAAKGKTEDLGAAWDGLMQQMAATIWPDLFPLIDGLISAISGVGRLRDDLRGLQMDWINAMQSTGLFGNAGNYDSFIGKTAINTYGQPGEGASAAEWKNYFNSVPGHASGGIVTQPHLAMVGEAGPEAIIPLNQFNGGGGITFIHNGTLMGNETEARKFARMIQDNIREDNRIRTSVRGT